MTAAKPFVQTFGKYQILDRIATGPTAEIYRARIEGIGGFQRTLAIKRVLPHLAEDPGYVEALVEEAKVAAVLSHANIVQILDLGQIEGAWFIAMEHVEGRDLGRVLDRARDKGLSLPLPHTVHCVIEVLKGLEYAHQRQGLRSGRTVALEVIHRHVTPTNVLLSFQGEVKLTDFGIARVGRRTLELLEDPPAGRFDYASPEQVAGAKDVDQRSDLFSVGVVLYEMLTGAHPFRAGSDTETGERVRAGRYEPVSNVNPGIPFTLETIVDRALRVDRNERYPSATAMKEALDKFFHDSGFLFTQSTLAAYLRGLFADHVPEAPVWVTPVPVVDAPEEADAEHPDDPEPVDAPPLDPSAAILPPALLDAVEATSPGLDTAWAEDPVTLVGGGIGDERPIPVTPSTPDTVALPQIARPTALVLGGILVVGLLGGGVAGALLAGNATASRLAGALALPDPVVRVVAPEGGGLRLDGIRIQGERILPPGQTIRVRAERGGILGPEVEITVRPGEVYQFVILPPPTEEPDR